MRLVGVGAELARAQLISVGDSLALRITAAIQLPIGTVYKHLGTQTKATGAMGEEVAARANSATASVLVLRPRFLRRRELAESDRTHVARSIVDSQLMVSAGAWNALEASQQARLEAVRMKALRPIAGCEHSDALRAQGAGGARFARSIRFVHAQRWSQRIGFFKKFDSCNSDGNQFRR